MQRHPIHIHKIDWHEIGVHFGHLIHDPRFWAIVGLFILFSLMILTLALSRPGNLSTNPMFPTYPYVPH